MNKATLVLVTLAALAIGALVGSSFSREDADDRQPNQAVAASTNPKSTIDTSTTGGDTSTSGGAPPFRYLSPADVTVEKDEFGQALPSVVGENFIPRDSEWKTDTVSFELAVGGRVEYKVVMNQGDTIVYNWKVDSDEAYYDFHAHDPAFGNEFFTRYSEGRASVSAGAIVAAYEGQHGWYWVNIEDKPVRITLKVAGFFDEIIEIKLEVY